MKITTFALAALSLAACSGTAPPERSVETLDQKAAAATGVALQAVSTPIKVQHIKKTVSLTSWEATANGQQWLCSADDAFRLPDCKRAS